jgi:hypothetical protein
LKVEDYLRTRFASLMYPAAQAFVLNPLVRRVLFCVPFWVIYVILTFNSIHKIDLESFDSSYQNYLSEISTQLSNKIIPTLQSFYLILIWKIFGRSEIVTEIAFLPFKLGLVWQLMGLGDKVLGPFKAPIFVMASMLILGATFGIFYPFLITNLVWLFFFLFALNKIYPIQDNLKRNNLMVVLSLSGLLLTGLEGIITTCLLINFEILSIFVLENYGERPLSIFTKKAHILSIFNTLKPYLLGAAIAFGYLIFQHYQQEWISQEAYYRLEFKKSIIVSDGTPPLSLFAYTVLISIITIYCLSKLKIKNLLPNSRLIVLLFGLMLICNFIFNQDLFNSNYLILNLLCLKLISDLKASKIQIVLYVGFFIALIMLYFSR